MGDLRKLGLPRPVFPSRPLGAGFPMKLFPGRLLTPCRAGPSFRSLPGWGPGALLKHVPRAPPPLLGPLSDADLRRSRSRLLSPLPAVIPQGPPRARSDHVPQKYVADQGRCHVAPWRAGGEADVAASARCGAALARFLAADRHGAPSPKFLRRTFGLGPLFRTNPETTSGRLGVSIAGTL